MLEIRRIFDFLVIKEVTESMSTRQSMGQLYGKLIAEENNDYLDDKTDNYSDHIYAKFKYGELNKQQAIIQKRYDPIPIQVNNVEMVKLGQHKKIITSSSYNYTTS